MKDDRLYMIHMMECIEHIEAFTAEGREKFMESELINTAVVHKLQIMAESSKRLPERWKTAHPEIDWRKVAGFRNILVHDYLETNLEECWAIVQNELPLMKQAVRRMLEESK